VATAEFSSVIPMAPEDLFRFLFQDGAWERGLPPLFQADRLEDGPFREGTVLRWRINSRGFVFNWAIQLDKIEAPVRVEVKQVLGVFNSWTLTQTLEDHGGNTLLKDLIEYDMPLGLIGRLTDDLVVRRELKKLLEKRHDKIRELIERKKNN
jgi:ligand-binding SRPBCC domain-containing protein